MIEENELLRYRLAKAYFILGTALGEVKEAPLSVQRNIIIGEIKRFLDSFEQSPKEDK